MNHISPPISDSIKMSQRKKIAIVTCADLPELFGGEQLLPPALRLHGVDVDICIWNDANVQWQQYDAVVIRCPWDYYEHFSSYMAWLNELERQDILVLNDIPTMRWNLNKKYLLELAQRGVAIIPTLLLSKSDQRSLTDIMNTQGWNEVVIKPIESAGAWRTLKVTQKNVAESEIIFANWRNEHDYLCQPFMPEIVEVGEWSLIYFNGEYSHSLIKCAKKDDFRVQSDHGGTCHVQEAPEHLRLQANMILQAIPTMPCYARVDGVVRDRQLLLMEIELAEPELFLELKEDAADQFAKAIIQNLKR
jgi:glutathione synthase/RimK-type ligase-like ATP-grasp enzyme